ncbi:helix-turn-helix domain-containing protein [Thermus thermophilus]|nr:helix-turn-helix transcriptional regulator [Thermus thermophilus]
MRHMLATKIDPAKLKAAMKRKGLTPRTLAERMGLNPSTIRYYLSGKRGKRPSYATLLALANALGLESVEEILASSLSSDFTNVGNKEESDALASRG